MRGRQNLIGKARLIGHQPTMQRRLAGQANPRRNEAALRCVGDRPEGILQRAQKRGLGLVGLRIHGENRPARLVGDDPAKVGDPAIFDIDDHRALRPAFAHAAPLQIAGIDDIRIARHDLKFMDVAERPIIVAARRHVREGAGCIGCVTRATVAGRVQQADVEPAMLRLRIGERPIVGYLARRETATVNGHAQVLQQSGLGFPRRKDRNGFGQRDGRGHDTLGVMISLDDVDRDQLAMEPRQFACKEQADRRIAPFAIIDVARYQDEGDPLVDSLRDKAGEGTTARLRKAACDGLVLEREAKQGAAQVQVGGMKEAEAHDKSACRKASTLPASWLKATIPPFLSPASGDIQGALQNAPAHLHDAGLQDIFPPRSAWREALGLDFQEAPAPSLFSVSCNQAGG